MEAPQIRVWEGAPLLDILNIIYLGANDVIPEDQVGTIKLYNCDEVHDIYKVFETMGDNNPMSTLKFKDTINVRLDGPIGTTGGTHYLEFNLFRGTYKGEVDLSWEPEDGELFVQKQTLESTDKTGKILVVTGRCANAMVANLEFKLLNSAARNVYGGIFSSNSKIERPHCANVLFLEKPPTGIKIGKDGVITLSKSCVGVPLDSELIVDLSLCLDDACPIINTLRFNPNKVIDVQSVAMGDGTATISVRVTWGRTIVLFPCDHPSGFEVEEDLALQFQSLQDRIRRSDEITPKINLPGISRRTLRKVIDFFRILEYPSANDFHNNYAKETYPDDLINLIQAAHFFKIKSLMDFTCQTLMEKISTKDPKVFMEEFHTAVNFARTERCQKSDEPAARGNREGSGKVLKLPDCVLRQRRKETFITNWRLVTVPIPTYATEQLVMIDRWNSVFDDCLAKVYSLRSIGHVEKLSEVFQSLIDFIIEDIKFADPLRIADVKMLFEVINGIDQHKNRKIQGLAVTILSYALLHGKNDVYLKDAVRKFVKLMSVTSIDDNIMGVDALSRIAYAIPNYVEGILKQGALERAHELLKKPLLLYAKTSCELIRCVANFLAAVCCGDSESIEVNLAIAISEELFQKNLGDNEHKLLACYALQYLTYGTPLKIEEAAWKKLIANLIKLSINFNDTSSQSGELKATDTGLKFSGGTAGLAASGASGTGLAASGASGTGLATSGASDTELAASGAASGATETGLAASGATDTGVAASGATDTGFAASGAKDTGLSASRSKDTGLAASGRKDTGLAASALGIVGNIARWGNLDQIQALAVDISLMECLRKMLRSGIKKFCKEACQIISNIAARNTTWIQAMYEYELIEPLCKLLIERTMSVSDVKLEAAWAIFNSIYGDKFR